HPGAAAGRPARAGAGRGGGRRRTGAVLARAAPGRATHGRVRVRLTYRQAVAAAIADAMAADDRVILIGEDVAAAGGAFKTTVGLLERFGPERVRDTPISEQAIVGA